MGKFQVPLWMPLVVLFAIGLSAFVLPSWTFAIVDLGKHSGISDAWAGFAGAIISAGMTIAATFGGAAMAWFAIKSQNRINVLTREEERIERELPGLVEASNYLTVLALSFNGYVSASGALSILSAHDFENSTTGFLEEVRRRLPSSSDALQRRLAANLHAIWATAVTIRAGEEAAERALRNAGAEQAPPDYRRETMLHWKSVSSDVSKQRSTLSDYAKLIISMSKEVNDRVTRLEARRFVCRSEIDRYFYEED